MRYHVLGPVTVTDGTSPLSPGGLKQRTVLAMLVAHRGRRVGTDLLIAAVYGDEPHDRARRTVQTYVSNLRRIVGDAIEREADGWTLHVDAETIDAEVFEDLCRAASSLAEESPAAASEVLGEALALWHGHPYADIEAHGFLDGEMTRLRELRVAAQASRIDVDLALGRHAEVIGEVEALLAEYPYQERFRAQHMLALYRSGRQREALRSYTTMHALLVEELGVIPNPELQQLEQRILEQDSALDLPPPTTIEKRAVLVVDPGDPIELARLPSDLRSALLDDLDRLVRSATEVTAGALVWPAGTSRYALMPGPNESIRAARSIVASTNGGSLRMAIDYGDVETSEESVSGPPVARAARLVAAAHPGQVLVSAEAQQALTADGSEQGIRLESLGHQHIHGLGVPTPVFQLLVGDPPRSFPPLLTDRTPPPLPGRDRRGVPGYELRDMIGRGSIGTVFRAFQPSIGREVAVEVIPRTVSSSDEFIRRFEADVQRLSLLEHPNVLPILDHWRDGDGAFIVYPYLRGGRLQDSIGQRDRFAMAEQIGSALGYAHSYGVTHGRLAPDRVILDEGDHPHVFGFPIAGHVEPAPESSAYVAPEVLEGEVGVAADVYSLGVLAYTLYTGSEPDPDTGMDLSRLARDVANVIADATAEDPADRYASVEELLGGLSLDAKPPGSRLTITRNPYKGLAAFQESDAADFYGRAETVAELLGVLSEGSLLAVVGPSGAGKSSVVRAGLIPAVRGGAIPGSERWVISDMLPGARPFEELARALERVTIELPGRITERLADHHPGSLETIRDFLPRQADLLLVVDQFEELFTLTPGRTRSEFMDLIIAASQSGTVRFVITLRADFLDRPLTHPGFAELLRQRTVVIGPPNSQELSESIAEPVANLGIAVEPDLIERLVNAVHDRLGALPLLQLTLSELFENRPSDVITLDQYERTGGLGGTVARRTEAIFSDLGSQEKLEAKRLMLGLVTLTEDGTPIRRRVGVGALGYQPGRQEVIDAFTRQRVLVLDRDPVSRTPTVEIAHEAVFSHWPRMSRWIEDLREDLILRRHLGEAAGEWEESGRNDAYLLNPARLAQYQEWSSQTDLSLTELEIDYFDASADHNRRQGQRRRNRRRWILTGFAAAALAASVFAAIALVSSNRANEQARVAEDQALIAAEQEAIAERNAEVARARELAVSARNVLEDDPELSLMLSVLASDITDPPAAALTSLHQSLHDHRAVLTIDMPTEAAPGGGTRGALSADGRYLAIAGFLGTALELWDLTSAEAPVWSHEIDEGLVVLQVLMTSDGTGVGVVARAGPGPEPSPPEVGTSLFLYDVTTGEQRSRHDLGSCGTAVFQLPGNLIEMTRDIIWLAETHDSDAQSCVPDTTEVRALNLGTDESRLLAVIEGGTMADSVTTSREGSRASVRTTEMSVVIDTRTGDELGTYPSRNPLALSPDGARVLTGVVDGTFFDPGGLVLVEVDSGEELLRFAGEDERFATAGFSRDGSSVYAQSIDDGTIHVFDSSTGIEVERLRGPRAGQATMMSGDMKRIVSLEPGSGRVWDLTTRGELAAYDALGEPTWVNLFAGTDVAGDVISLATFVCECRMPPGSDSLPPEQQAASARVKFFSMSTGEPLIEVPNGGQSGQLLESGDLVAVQSLDLDHPDLGQAVGSIRILDLATGGVRAELEGLCEWNPWTGHTDSGCRDFPETPFADNFWTMESSPDDQLLAIGASHSKALIVWSTESGRIAHIAAFAPPNDDLSNPSGGHGPPLDISFSPDGLLVGVSAFTESGPVVAVYDTTTWEEKAMIEPPAPGWSLLFSPDGSTLFLGDWNGTVTLYDTASWQQVEGFETGSDVSAMAISQSGDALAIGYNGGKVDIWRLAEKAITQSMSFDSLTISHLQFLDDHRLLVSPYEEPVQVIALDPVELVAIARSRITRALTSEECATYGIDPCPTLEAMRDG